jgi:outer membrane protein insertion porin family
LAVLWVSPFGPIKISAAQPFRAKDNDQKQRFQFTFGQQF